MFYDEINRYKIKPLVNNWGGGFMKTIYCSWKDEQIKQLFAFVEEGKQNHKPLLTIFKDFAQISGRKPNSVRNYYYLELNELQTNIQKQNRLGIDLSKHEKIKQMPFDEDEEKEVVMKILRLCANGMSVRRACLEMSSGDLGKMIRFQNKYRNCLKNNPKLIRACVEELKSEGIESKIEEKIEKPRPNNVLVMPKQKELSDKDIEALFMGLVRLVKRVACEQAQTQNQIANKTASENLAKAYVELSNRDSKIKTLSKSVEQLKIENKTLKTRLEQKRASEVEGVVRSQKMQDLKSFAGSIAKKNKQKLKA